MGETLLKLVKLSFLLLGPSSTRGLSGRPLSCQTSLVEIIWSLQTAATSGIHPQYQSTWSRVPWALNGILKVVEVLGSSTGASSLLDVSAISCAGGVFGDSSPSHMPALQLLSISWAIQMVRPRKNIYAGLHMHVCVAVCTSCRLHHACCPGCCCAAATASMCPAAVTCAC
jgi:hypothetical protein